MEARTALRSASLTCRTRKRRPSSPSNPSGRGQASWKGLWTRVCPSKHAEGQTAGRSARKKTHLATRSGGGTFFFLGGVPEEFVDFKPSRVSPSTPIHGGGRVRAAVDGSETNVCLHWKQGGDPTGGHRRYHGPVRRPSEKGAP